MKGIEFVGFNWLDVMFNVDQPLLQRFMANQLCGSRSFELAPSMMRERSQAASNLCAKLTP